MRDTKLLLPESQRKKLRMNVNRNHILRQYKLIGI